MVAVLVLGGWAGLSHANLINGDFETGDFTGWTIFTFDTAGSTGSTGSTAIVPFDTDGDLVTTNSARFQVGQVSPGQIGGGVFRAGGGILQIFTAQAGQLHIAVDIASSSSGNSADGGLFELLLDGVLLDSVDFGFIGVGVVERDLLMATPIVTAGAHELRIRMVRGYGTDSSTPFQYVDNVLVSSIPEPTALALFGIGLLVLGYGRYRKKRKYRPAEKELFSYDDCGGYQSEFEANDPSATRLRLGIRQTGSPDN